MQHLITLAIAQAAATPDAYPETYSCLMDVAGAWVILLGALAMVVAALLLLAVHLLVTRWAYRAVIYAYTIVVGLLLIVHVLMWLHIVRRMGIGPLVPVMCLLDMGIVAANILLLQVYYKRISKPGYSPIAVK